MLAEVVDAVVGGDTHRDTHALELTAPSGATIATLSDRAASRALMIVIASSEILGSGLLMIAGSWRRSRL
jgi:hypothetical protein